MPAIKWNTSCHNNTNGTINYDCIVHSDNIWDASLWVAHSELGDKTFILLIVFTILWSPLHLGYVFRKSKDKSKNQHS